MIVLIPQCGRSIPIILEVIMISDVLVEYNFLNHVASDIGSDQLLLCPENSKTQNNLDSVAAVSS